MWRGRGSIIRLIVVVVVIGRNHLVDYIIGGMTKLTVNLQSEINYLLTMSISKGDSRTIIYTINKEIENFSIKKL